MTKIGVNQPCPCTSGKKYKKCCMINDLQEKQKIYNEMEKIEKEYINGQTTENSAKINFCIKHYKSIYPDYKVINLTDIMTPENYKQIQLKNFYKNTIILIEKTDKNIELFNQKSNNNTNDLIILYKGSYRIFEAIDILKYDNDIKNMINKRNNGINDI
jgi:hypothetical protein